MAEAWPPSSASSEGLPLRSGPCTNLWLALACRDLAAKLKEGRQSEDAEVAAERDLEAGLTAGTAATVQLAEGGQRSYLMETGRLIGCMG